MNNSEVIVEILKKIISTLSHSKLMFLSALRQGVFPVYSEFKNQMFKNSMLISQAKQLSV